MLLPPQPTKSQEPPTKDRALRYCRAFLTSLIGNSQVDQTGRVDGDAARLRQYIRETAPWLLEQIDGAKS